MGTRASRLRALPRQENNIFLALWTCIQENISSIVDALYLSVALLAGVDARVPMSGRRLRRRLGYGNKIYSRPEGVRQYGAIAAAENHEIEFIVTAHRVIDKK